MAPTQFWLLSALLSFLFPLIAADTQVIFSDEPGDAMTEEVADLLQSSIWVDQNKTDTSETALHCCNILSGTLPGRVYFPESPEYQAQQASYYQQANADLSPRCRVSPTSAVEVSAIVSLATRYDCPFAVRSGGHMISKGFSNVDATGFTIDLERMNEVAVADGGKIVSFGAGCRWQQVYSVLRPLNLTTVGGRAPSVGVSGFLLGGGISALSVEHGFGSSNIINYQVVLADGAIHDVNANMLPDLYWALKYGSTNFAIVTRFDMTTYPLPTTIWGGLLVFEISKGRELLQFHVDFTRKLAEDPKGLNVIGIAWEPVQQTYIIWSPNMYLDPVVYDDEAAPYSEYPALYDSLQDILPEALINTMRPNDLLSIIGEWEAMAPQTARAEWFTLTLKADAALMWDIHRKGVKLFEPYLNRAGFSWAAIFQPLNAGFASAGEKRNGGHPSGIVAADGDLIVLLGSALWADPTDDAVLKEKVHELWRWAERTARERELLHPFVYMNYALALQDVMGGIGEENVQRMRAIKNVYDPQNRFAEYWRGGFKL